MAEDLEVDASRRPAPARDSREFTFDVLMDGSPVRRAVPVEVSETELVVGDERLPLDTVFWVSRRAGLVLLFARDRTLAVLGKSGDLEELARAVERGSDRTAQRSLLQPLTREIVVCTAGTAVSGFIGDTRVSGLHLAVFTQRGLHLFAGSRTHSLEWPVSRVGELSTAPGEHGRGGLRLNAEGVSVTLRYLFPEEIQAVARVARREPRPPPAPDRALEMFAKGEVAPAPAPELPRFTASADALHDACETATRRVRVDRPMSRRLGPGFFASHFQELGEIALGPLVLRRSAAAAAETLARAAEALDAEQLREDADAAFLAATDHLFEVYGGAVEALIEEKRLDRDGPNAARSTDRERDRLGLVVAKQRGMLDPAFERVLARQHLLQQRLKAHEHAPPDAEETGVAEAAEDWREAIVQLDRVYGAAWTATLSEIADIWSERFLPRLAELAAVPRRRLSEGARLAILATVTFAAVAALAWWLF